MTVPAFRHFRLLSMAILVGACWHIQSAQSEASGLLIADGGLGGVLEIKEHDVSVVINNGIAVTEVRQIFHNTEQRIVEALYTFPVPAGASVSNFSMIINGKEMIGEVVEKKRARQIYESYKTVKRDPGLLEQVDYKTFELRIFPIPAGADQHIKVTYCQQLDFDHNNAKWVYPLSTTTRKGINQKTTGKFALLLVAEKLLPDSAGGPGCPAGAACGSCWASGGYEINDVGMAPGGWQLLSVAIGSDAAAVLINRAGRRSDAIGALTNRVVE